ncbi:hypothetical protein NIES4075_35150 [Tolypothrix sp. NIES-4075]|nr:hypothetical protein NIES4075_35150 [Tolypothrix sp. NIES-4075]
MYLTQPRTAIDDNNSNIYIPNTMYKLKILRLYISPDSLIEVDSLSLYVATNTDKTHQ